MMEILLDTANTGLIRRYCDIYEIAGVTSNPTILSREKRDFFEVLTEIRGIIGSRQLHVQVTGLTPEAMLKEAEVIRRHFGEDTYLKVPVNEAGIAAIRALKAQGCNVTATAVYTAQQAVMAASVGADYVAPYFNRMENNHYDAAEQISEMAEIFASSGVHTKILAASFKNTRQIMNAMLAGAQAVTADPALYSAMVGTPLAEQAIEGFRRDWISLCGDKTIDQLEQR